MRGKIIKGNTKRLLCPSRRRCGLFPEEKIWEQCGSWGEIFCPIYRDKFKLRGRIRKIEESARKLSLLVHSNKGHIDKKTQKLILTGCEVTIEQITQIFNDISQKLDIPIKIIKEPVERGK